MTPNDRALLENVRLAAGCGAAPSMVLSVALASTRATTVDEAFDRFIGLRTQIAELHRQTPRPHRALAELDHEGAEVARMRLDVGDHEIRGRLVFGELVGKRSFLQVAALEIAGVDLSASDGALLEEMGVIAQIADPRVWPSALARRIRKNGGSLAEAVTAGVASFCTPQMTGLPSAGFMQFLDHVEQQKGAGESVAAIVRDTLERGQHVLGVGRPVLRGDERVAPMLAAIRRHGRGDGASVRLALEVDDELARQKGLRMNSAGLCGAAMRDMGFSPDAAAAFCVLYFVVPILAHSTAAAAKRVDESEKGTVE